MWGRVLKLICENLGERELYILEADKDMKWYGVPLRKLCDNLQFNGKVADLVRSIKAELGEMSGTGWVVYVDPYNFFADVYEADKPRYRNRWNPERPSDISEKGFRVGFFGSKEEAYDFFVKIAKTLKDTEGIKFDVVAHT